MEKNGRSNAVEEIARKNIEQIAILEENTRQTSPLSIKLADIISKFCGTSTFVYIHLVWFSTWIVVNSSLSEGFGHFDPYPFEFLTLVVSLEAIFLSTFILISQNRQARISERRNLLDLQINLLAEQENSKMLIMLSAIQQKLGIDSKDPEVVALEERIDPCRIAKQIDAMFDACTSEKATPNEQKANIGA